MTTIHTFGEITIPLANKKIKFHKVEVAFLGGFYNISFRGADFEVQEEEIISIDVTRLQLVKILSEITEVFEK